MREPDSNHIGRYELLSKVGQGANGVVYRAQDPTIRRVVALKVIPADPADPAPGGTTGGTTGRTAGFFAREAQAAGALLHPNIVTLYDAGRDADWYYLAMEFIEGETFADEIARGVDRDRIVQVVSAVARALDYAHQHSVIHRDIKPANLMILADKTVKVADFGIARLTSSSSTMTTDMMVGTPFYMSPEQVRGGKLDGRSDLFSLGVVLYEALTGTKPFEANNVAAILNRIMNAPITPPHEIDPAIPRALSDVVMRTLARSPDERFARGTDLADALDATTAPEATTTGAAPRAPAPSRSRGPLIAAAVLTGLVATVAAVRFGNLGSATGVTQGSGPKPASAAKGYLRFESEPSGADVYVDGELVGRTPFPAWEAQVGSHEVEYRKDGFWPSSTTAKIDTRDQKVEVFLEMYPREEN